jgi:hypothetical protein
MSMIEVVANTFYVLMLESREAVGLGQMTLLIGRKKRKKRRCFASYSHQLAVANFFRRKKKPTRQREKRKRQEMSFEGGWRKRNMKSQ